LGALVIAAKEKGLLTKGGGHILAAGFSLKRENIEKFREFVGEYIVAKLGNNNIASVKKIDAVLDLGAANVDLADNLEQLEPFGNANPEPVLMFRGVRIVKASAMGIGHVRCILTSDNGASVKAVAFRVGDNQIGQAMLSGSSVKYDVCGVLRRDRWQGKSGMVQFIIDDIRETA
jgi:single-stranded-DNA-specific exonuclease